MLKQFLQDADGQLSSTRLIALGAFITSSGVLIAIHNETALGAYLTAWVVHFIGSKYNEVLRHRDNKKK